MTLPPEISVALGLLDLEYNSLVAQIDEARSDHQAAEALPMHRFEELMNLYKKRDRLANVRNNLRAYFSDSP